MFETERRFFINQFLTDIIVADERTRGKRMVYENIEQVYMTGTGDWSIRYRQVQPQMLNDYDFVLTMKKRISDMTSIEIEHQVTAKDYDFAKAHADHEPIQKRRWHHPESKFTIDEFVNASLLGLVIAEIELPHETWEIELPRWIGLEITGIQALSNAALAHTSREEMQRVVGALQRLGQHS